VLIEFGIDRIQLFEIYVKKVIFYRFGRKKNKGLNPLFFKNEKFIIFLSI
jgi:hypothetical protein